MRRMKMASKMAMKAMKMSSMKMRMKMKAKKVSKTGKKWQVFAGKKEKSKGGLKKTDLIKNKNGKVVSKKMSLKGKKVYQQISAWTVAFNKARKTLGVKGFVPCGGKTAQGQALLKKTRSFYKA